MEGAVVEAEGSTNPNITPAKREFIEKVGLFYEQYGLTRIGGRMLGLMMVASAPMTIQQMAETLRVSRSSITTNLRMLSFVGVIERVAIPGEVRDYYRLAPRAWEQTLQARVQAMRALQAMTVGVLVSMPPEDPAMAHLSDLNALIDLMNTMYLELIEKWRTTQEIRRNVMGREFAQ